VLTIRKKKLLLLLAVIALGSVLYGVILSRNNSDRAVIFGGSDDVYVMTNSHVKEQEKEEEVNPNDLLDWPEIDLELEQYFIVNDDNLLSSAFDPDVSQIPGTYMMWSTAEMSHLTDLIDFMKSKGFTVHIGGAYRSYSFQTQLFNGKASQIALGMGVTDYMDPKYQEAAEEARTITMYPGASEHQLGLAVDLMDRSYQKLVYENMDQEFFKVLDEHCAEFGFIKRYPTKKLLLTGWDEPWHYRYVGVEAATFIMEHDLCYEEFYAHYSAGFTY